MLIYNQLKYSFYKDVLKKTDKELFDLCLMDGNILFSYFQKELKINEPPYYKTQNFIILGNNPNKLISFYYSDEHYKSDYQQEHCIYLDIDNLPNLTIRNIFIYRDYLSLNQVRNENLTELLKNKIQNKGGQISFSISDGLYSEIKPIIFNEIYENILIEKNEIKKKIKI